MSVFDSFATVRPYKIWDGAVARAITGENVQVALIDIVPNARVPQHHHHNEQAGFIVQGSLVFTVGDEVRELHAGDTYVIPGNLPHSAVTGPDGCVVIDTFSPPRSDWEALERLEPGPGEWPASQRTK